MSYPYNLRRNPKRKVLYSPPWPQSKRFERNNQNRTLEGSMNTSNNSTSSMRDDVEPEDQSQQGAATGHSNFEIPQHVHMPPPPFNQQPPRGQPPFFQYQRVPQTFPQNTMPPSNVPPPSNDSNLASYIQSAIREGLRSNSQNDAFATELVRSMRAMTDRIERGFENIQTHLSGRSSQNIPNPPSAAQDQSEAESDVNRLERMVQNLTLQMTSISERLNANGQDNSQQSAPVHNPRSQSRTAFGTSSNWRLPPHQWNVKFSGDKNSQLTALDFLNILSLKRDAHDVTWELIGAHFDNLLEGRALNWYFSFRKRNPQVSWVDLREAFTQHFSRRETDQDITMKISLRRQHEKESFDEFCDAMFDLRNQLIKDFSDEEMIGYLRKNCKLGIRQMIATYSTNDIDAFIDQCRDREQLCPSQQFRKVHELHSDVPYPLNSSGVSQDPSPSSSQLNPMVEAFRNPSYSQNLKCWNCDEVGHGFMECEKERTLFCYKCGTKNVTCRNCTKFRNFRVQEILTGESLAQSTNPESIFPNRI